MTLLTATNLIKKYDDIRAVDDISFQFEAGKCVALIGANGAGKTTTLRMLAGLIKATSGHVTLQGMKANDDIRSYIGYLPQHPVFHSWMTGKEFLVYVGKLAYLTNSEAEQRADKLLEKVNIYEARNRGIHTYSGGMKQRLGIAQAIIHQPKLLLLDEPVSSLDPLGRRDVLTLMEELKEDLTILFSTHILSDADEVSDELLLLHNGKIVESGAMDDLRKRYQTSAIELQFENGIELYTEKINKLPSVYSSSIKRDTITVLVNDLAKARKEILTIAVDENWSITNFTINKASLEEMFMKAVE